MVTGPRRLGSATVFPIALGCASWSLLDLQTPGREITPQLENTAIQTVHAALDQGVNLFDTARAYTTPRHPGHSEALIARAIRTHPGGYRALVATKADTNE